jgi:hypothetical protein
MSGTVGPRISPFINTYSLDFDGIDDYLNLGRITAMEGATNFSFSMWVYPTSYTGLKILFGKFASATDFFFAYTTNVFGYIQWFIADGQTNYPKVTTSARIDLNNWGLLTFVYDGSLSGNLNKAKIYINGTLAPTTTTIYQMPSSISLDTTDFYVAQRNGALSTPMAGKIDEVSAYDYSLSASEVTDIYNLGTPTDLSLLPTPPLNWYRMGDNGAYKSPQWLIPSNENKDKVSNYSMEFDGVNDYIDLGDSDDFSFGNGTTDSPFSISIWVNFSSIGGSTFKGIIGKDNGAQREWALLDNNSGRLRIFLKNQGGGNQQSIDTTSVLSINTWYHIVATYNGVGGNNAADGLTLYLNGIEETPTNIIKNTYVAMSNTIAPLTIGKYSLNEFPGNIDATSIFNRELSISEVTSIYNGGGVATPGDLTPLNPIAWWKMGEDSTFSGGVWTVPDEVGSNDGTSVNMTIEDRVGTAPNSKNNAVSYNMDLIDRVEDTPSTT